MKNKRVIVFFACIISAFWACQSQSYPTATAGTNTNTANIPKIEKFVPDYPLNRFEEEVKSIEKLDSTQGIPQGQILFYGSSSFKYWKSVQHDLENNKILNHGFGGSTFPELSYYADRMLTPLNPKTIVIYCENDMFMAKPKTAEQTFDDYKELVEKIRQKLPSTRIFTLSLKPSPARKAKLSDMEKLNEAIKNYTQKSPNMFYVDISNVMLDSTGAVNGRLFRTDSLHMNETGYQLWTDVLKDLIK